MTVAVPNVPGVPPVLFAPGIDALTTLLENDALALFAGVIKAPWGLYQGALPVLVADNVTSFTYKQDYEISDFPVEAGQFQSYNKVYLPFETTFRFTAGGDLVNRQKFLDEVAALIGDLNLYNVVTADAIYIGVNLVSYRYQQTAESGVGLIAVDITAKQVKLAAPLPFLDTLNPFSSLQVNGGVVQAIAPLASMVASISSIIGLGF